MKIPLNFGQSEPTGRDGAIPEHEILAAKEGDWNAKAALTRRLMPLMTSLAQRRASDPAKINMYIEAGQAGLMKAARRYKKKVGPQRFRIYALDFIERAMDAANRPSRGFFSRLFGG